VESQWELAEWCRERRLLPQRDKHLSRILDMDPNHEKARRALGFSKSGDKWSTREGKMTARGYVRYGGKWLLPQAVELLEAEKKTEAAEGHWQQEIKRWRTWLDGSNAQAARDKFLTINDPYAVKPLALALNDERNPTVRLLYVESLAKIGTQQAIRVLSAWVMKEANEEVALTCLDHLKGHEDPVTYLVGRLGSSDNDEINRAAFALQRMEDPIAVRPLIDVLVTTHKRKVTIGGGSNAAFGGGGGGGLTMGSKTKIISRELQNRSVLEALVALADGPNFSFNVPAWRSWYSSQRRPTVLDARRD
jgi:hypothetical protein